jgi:hypothetical protein
VVEVEVGVDHEVDRVGVEPGGPEPLHERPRLVVPEGEGAGAPVAHAGVDDDGEVPGLDHERLHPQAEPALVVGGAGRQPAVALDEGLVRGGEEQRRRDPVGLRLDHAGDTHPTQVPPLGRLVRHRRPTRARHVAHRPDRRRPV